MAILVDLTKHKIYTVFQLLEIRIFFFVALNDESLYFSNILFASKGPFLFPVLHVFELCVSYLPHSQSE